MDELINYARAHRREIAEMICEEKPETYVTIYKGKNYIVMRRLRKVKGTIRKQLIFGNYNATLFATPHDQVDETIQQASFERDSAGTEL